MHEKFSYSFNYFKKIILTCFFGMLKICAQDLMTMKNLLRNTRYNRYKYWLTLFIHILIGG